MTYQNVLMPLIETCTWRAVELWVGAGYGFRLAFVEASALEVHRIDQGVRLIRSTKRWVVLRLRPRVYRGTSVGIRRIGDWLLLQLLLSEWLRPAWHLLSCR